ncbi:hypothetical protein CsSME_00035690 [Camellia sinensis var. sinensis]
MNSNPEDTEMRNNDADKRPSPNKPYQEKAQDTKLWGVFFFGLIGATVTKFLLNRSQSSWKGPTGGSFRSSFQGEARKRHNRRMQEEYEEEMERVERIKRMQSVFNRERNKNKRSYESWRESGPGVYHQHFQREDWGTSRDRANYAYSHHYSVLGLDRLRTKPYTDDEIKSSTAPPNTTTEQPAPKQPHPTAPTLLSSLPIIWVVCSPRILLGLIRLILDDGLGLQQPYSSSPIPTSLAHPFYSS